MKGQNMKRRTAAMLCMAMLLTQSAAIAGAEATPSEAQSTPLVELIVPEAKPEVKSEPVLVEAVVPEVKTEAPPVEAITPEGTQPEAPKPKLTISASVSGMVISVSLSGNQNAAADAMITAPDGSYQLWENLSDSASFTYTAPSAGTYNIYAEYRQGGGSDEINVEVKAPVE